MRRRVTNEYEEINDKTTELTIKGRNHIAVVLVDTEDVARLKECGLHWCLTVRGGYVVVYGKVSGTSSRVVMSRFLLDAPKGFDVDHINHNPCDNRKSNLRLATKSENGQNRKGATKRSKSGVRGVSQCARSGKWTVRVKEPGGGPYMYFGRFDTIAEAEVVAKKARSVHQPFSEEALVA